MVTKRNGATHSISLDASRLMPSKCSVLDSARYVAPVLENQCLKDQTHMGIKCRAGLVVALALIPEASAFSIIAGVDPKVGLDASFCIFRIIAFLGGRPAIISAAIAPTCEFTRSRHLCSGSCMLANARARR